MIRFFKSTQLANLFIIPVIILAFWVRSIFQVSPVSDSNAMPLWDVIVSVLSVFPSWINFIFLVALVCGQIIYLNLMLNKHAVLYKNSFLPALLGTLLISASPALLQFHSVYLINLVLIFILDRIFSLNKDEMLISRLFDCGFFAAIASLIYFPAIIILPFLLTALSILRPFRLKEWLIIISGFGTPFFLICTYFFWNHTLVNFIQSYVHHFTQIRFSAVIEKNEAGITLSVFVGLMLLLSLFKLAQNFRKNVIRTRNYQSVFISYLIFGIGWLAFTGGFKIIHLAFLVLPASVFCGYYFLLAKRRIWIYETGLLVLIAIIAWNHLG